jgi:hypothetical protein
MAYAQQSAEDQILQTTRSWLKNVSQGDRAGLNAIMDAGFIAVTPGGEVLTKERLVPDDPAQPVQQLPPLEMNSPLVRVHGDTAVLMTHLTTPAVKQALNGTFVYSKAGNFWKLVALHISPIGE